MATSLRYFNITTWYNHPLHRKGRILITMNRSDHGHFTVWKGKKIKTKLQLECESSTTTKWYVSLSGRWLDDCNQQPSGSVVLVSSGNGWKLLISWWKCKKMEKHQNYGTYWNDVNIGTNTNQDQYSLISMDWRMITCNDS